MIVIVGLGNPGEKYKNTRHNIGFQIVDEFTKKNNFPEFRFSKKYNALISEKDNIILAKPQTFMNESGKCVKKLLGDPISQHVGRSGLLVAHDDIDLPLGKIRISKNRGSAGHKGVESIIKEIRTKNFVRFRVGIKNQELRIKNVEDFVLQRFTKEEEKIIKEIIKKTVEAIKLTLKEGLEKKQ